MIYYFQFKNLMNYYNYQIIIDKNITIDYHFKKIYYVNY